MEANEYDMNRVDSDVLLPPRKRLLAGLKRQSSESASQSSPESYSPAPMSEVDLRLQNLLKFYKSGPKMSREEIANAAEIAAVAAAKAAVAARAVAQEKAVIAAKAVAAAKQALSLVVSKGFSGTRDGQSKKNKLKKHVPVQLLYKEQQQQTGVKCGMDEELAQKLHRTINSSPRISNHSLGSKDKHKKHKPSLEANGFVNGVEANGMPNYMNPQVSFAGSYVAEVVSGEGESSHSKDKIAEPSDAMHFPICRKRGRIKQKKLPLSLCNSKDRANPKDELNQSSSPSTQVARENKLSTGSSTAPSSVEPRANTSVTIEPAPTWKCQDLQTPQCIKPNKVVQS